MTDEAHAALAGEAQQLSPFRLLPILVYEEPGSPAADGEGWNALNHAAVVRRVQSVERLLDEAAPGGPELGELEDQLLERHAIQQL